MKKWLLLGIGLVFLCGGCGANTGKNLVCTNTQNSDGLKIDATADMHFTSDKIDNVKLTMEVFPESDEMKSNWSYIESAYNTKYAKVEKDGLKVSSKADSSNKKYTIVIEAVPTKVTKEDLEKYGIALVGTVDSYNQVKQDMEKEGYTCK